METATSSMELFNTGNPVTDYFHSVEFRADNAEFMYQFRLWEAPARSMFVLVKQESDIINRIHTGDILHMTYHGIDTTYGRQRLPTRIVNIHRQDDGRFRGHYLVTLGIVEN